MKTIIINGANGYVAANFINKLLLQNYKVIALVRANKKHTSEERMESALAEINEGALIDTSNLEIYNYSLLDENFALQPKQLDEIFSGEVDYFHFAASLKFDSKSKEEIFGTNLRGLENSIDVYSKNASDDSRFFFISTAYSCGKSTEVFEEKFYDNEEISNFRNYYEQSKRFAENIIKKQMEENGLNAYIIRLSQVVGNNDSGVTKTDYGIFDFAKRIYSLSKRHPNKTVRVRVDPESTQNLIPIDTVVSYLATTVEAKNPPVIMNFIAKHSTKNSHIISSLNKLLPICIVPFMELKREDMDAIERVISVGMSFTGSYIDTNILFDTSKRDEIIRAVNNEASEETIYKMLAYFIEGLTEKTEKKKSSYSVNR